MKFVDPRTGFSQTALGDSRTQLGGIASLKFDLLRGRVRSYVLEGVGAFNIRDAVKAGTVDASTLSATQVGLDGGVGLRFAWATSRVSSRHAYRTSTRDGKA